MKIFTFLLLSLCFILSTPSFGHPSIDSTLKVSYEIKGLITDHLTGDPLTFAVVALIKNGKIISGTETDLDGRYSISVAEPGIYEIEVSYVGYLTKRVSGITVGKDSSCIYDIILEENDQCLNEIVITAYKVPLISKANFSLDGVSIGVHKRTKSNKKTKNQQRKISGTFNAEEYSHIVENEFISPKDEALSTFSIDVDRASYSNVRRIINENRMPPIDAVRVEEMINYFPYNYSEPVNDEPFSVQHHLMDCPWNTEHQILHLGIQGKRIEKEALPPSNLVFLIDVSGSMGTPNKLELVKSSLSLLVDNVREEDRIAIVVYAGAAGLVLESTSGAQKSIIKEAIQNLQSGGSTAGGRGIELAYKIAQENFIEAGNNRVIIATDGDFNVGISDEGGLVRLIEEKREKNIFLSVLGYGVGNYKDNKMQKLADAGNGNHAYVDDMAEAKKTLIHEFGSTLFTIAKDVKIQIEFNPEFVGAYKLIGYENRLLDKQDFNNDKKDAGDLGAGHSVTVFYEIIPAKNDKMSESEVDALKYQSMASSENTTDFATLKMRFKSPKGVKSQKVEWVILPNLSSMVNDEIQFGLCVAEFGLLLRESTSIENRNFQNLLDIVKPLVVENDGGYRSEFITLLEKVVALNSESEE